MNVCDYKAIFFIYILSLTYEFVIFQIRKFNMSEEGNKNFEGTSVQFSRRRRTPSKYAQSIKELTQVSESYKQMAGRTSKKIRKASSNDDEEIL